MNKRKKGRKFSRKSDVRKALLRALISALFLREKIKTTKAKAKEMSGFAEKFITKAKKGDLSSRRILAGYFTPALVKKLINDIAPRYKERNGGYTRVIKLGPRKSDGAKMAIIELVK
ncbi:MAG: 50S ribosomal protein L17 [Candidatus Nealsonbacteria bacterium RIFCSPLOWO2_12_FULL_39_31]|uniref:Large ribosomal subunit protein bL17 n=3 Tax=Candidatus Nealsoniibacteriota TaxID=1817911 RepID=A0A1G2EGC8_9BACT|nr:MAG: 50S ribosomal protein L17 [Parcubacteria group bacterium GW2011_GWA2_38_27]KKQ98064.1 MAG: 50S ribosomal protein L17 [Parcubacteria group bacterium GW2011_GWC2_39_11]OGZ19443.1 MAG: 50S ribosomal protein L17 [Candidatus Nealsonbacteria bacterium RIFCSPHIGHO2_01_FULL_38_55]OGZ21474.1 MAG: 50S ribosomal protein L17 [Candidatus Nealsonbacteria bacterium RIFCSPHIGHO2_02_FULL_38_75]OGZ22611.1 MAG: 50S ribosomal protein L17 [Candidatus Nealsonbacteria bacterium RIFCSPLOWO2_01_FULL_38_120]OGZ